MSWPENRLTKRLGIAYPIIQCPLGGFRSQRLTAAVSNGGGLGSFGAHSLTPDAIREVIGEIRGMTAKPFAMNLWVSMEDDGAPSSDERAFVRALAPLLPHFADLQAPQPVFTPYAPLRFDDQVRILIDARIPVVSFIFGIPSRAVLDDCRRHGIATIGTATTVEEAVALEQAGVDTIVASGFEAGGHRGAFLRPAEESLTGTMSLVPQVADAVAVPVIAAGGIGDARGVVAAMALGAEAVQIGTAFLSSEGSGASRLHRDALIAGRARDTGLTRGFTGRLARGIRNPLMTELNRPGTELLPYPLQRALVKHLASAAETAGRTDLLPLWAGQSASLAANPDASAFLRGLVEEVSAIAGSVAEWSAGRRAASNRRHGDQGV